MLIGQFTLPTLSDLGKPRGLEAHKGGAWSSGLFIFLIGLF